MLYFLFFFLSISSLIICDQLQFVTEVFRHGARAPTKNEAQYTHYNFPGLKYGELSYPGIRQHYILGYELRKNYITNQNFLSASFDPSELYIQSDTVGRCIRSATSQLYGLYPLGTGPSLPQGINPNLTLPPYANITYPYQQLGNTALPQGFQAYPINIVAPPFWDVLLMYGPQYYCNQSQQLKQQQWRIFQTQQQFDSIRQVFNQTFANMSQIYGINVTLDNFFEIYVAEMANYMQNNQQNLTIPNSTLWKNIDFVNNYQYQYGSYGSDYLKQLYFTPFSQNLLQWLDGKISKQNPNKMFILAGHDSTVAPILAGLNLTSPECIWDIYSKGSTNALNCMTGYPQFASNVIVELYQNSTSQDYYVKVKYNQVYANLCEKNLTTCDYNEFRQRLIYGQKDYMTICQINSESQEKNVYQDKIEQIQNYSSNKIPEKIDQEQKEKQQTKLNQTNSIINNDSSFKVQVQQTNNQEESNLKITIMCLLFNFILGGIIYFLYQKVNEKVNEKGKLNQIEAKVEVSTL